MNRPSSLRTSICIIFFSVVIIFAFLQPFDLGKLVKPNGKTLIELIELAENNSIVAHERQVRHWTSIGEKLNLFYSPGNNSEVANEAENISIVADKNNDFPMATVVVATLFISEQSLYKGLGFWTIAANFQNYSKIHGYDLHIQTEVPNFNRSLLCKTWNCLPIEARWYKIEVIIDLLDKGYDWVFWTDADTLFTNLTQELPIPLGTNGTEIIIGGDHVMVNSGHILLHNSLWTQKFLQAWLEMKKARNKYILQDNSGLVVLLALGIEDALKKNVSELGRIEHNKAQTRWKITTQEEATRAMDQKMHKSFRGKIKIVPQNMMNAYPQTWKAGLLLVHLAGKEYTNGEWVRKMGLLKI